MDRIVSDLEELKELKERLSNLESDGNNNDKFDMEFVKVRTQIL
jgi:hypothetical protein